MIDYEIALCDVAEVMRRHNKAQLGGYILPSDVAVIRIRNIVTPYAQWINSCCTECGTFTSLNTIKVKYCPECGARMLSETEKSHIEAEIGRINSFKEEPEA